MRESTTVHRFNGSALIGVVLSPLERLGEVPVWGRIIALLLALCQFVATDAFGSAIAIVLLASVVDYCVGAYAAKARGEWKPELARSGAMGKVSGLGLLVLIRILEWFASAQGLIESNGALATLVAVSLIAVDLQSIAHHRESFGARPIPFLSALFKWIEQLLSSRLPDPAARRSATRPPGGTDADVP